MVYDTKQMQSLIGEYKNPNDKISRMLKAEKYYSIIRGLYTDNENEDRDVISSRIILPSYISFEYALSKYQLIPENVKMHTLAMCGHNKTKLYDTSFGVYIYYNIPICVYKYGVKLVENKNGSYFIATPEKAILDMLYKEKPLNAIKNLKDYLFDNLRIDEEDFYNLNHSDLMFLIERYNCTNCKLLRKII